MLCIQLQSILSAVPYDLVEKALAEVGDIFLADAAPVAESSAIHHDTGAPNTLPNLFDIESGTRACPNAE